MQAMSQKLWDVDAKMQTMGNLLHALTASITKLTETIDKRGGLEDRVAELEKNRATAIKVGIGVVSAMGTILAGVLAATFRWLVK